MSQRSLDEIGAAQKARELFDRVLADTNRSAQRGPARTEAIREEAADYGQ